MLDDILATPAVCDLARDIQSRMRRARDQLLTFTAFPGRVEAHNDACERDLRPAVIQRKNTDGYRAMWSAKGEAAVRTVVATARITSGAGTFSTVLGTIGASRRSAKLYTPWVVTKPPLNRDNDRPASGRIKQPRG